MRHIRVLTHSVRLVELVGQRSLLQRSTLQASNKNVSVFPSILNEISVTTMAPPKSRKIAIMGYRSVGKSSITIQFVENQFVDSYDPTIENTFTRTMKINNQDYILQIVDTAGQDEYSLFPEAYILDIHGYILVYSVNSQKSFHMVKVIYEKLLDMVGTVQVPILLVGNKSDLLMDRLISTNDGKELAQLWGGHFLECSAKHNSEVQQIFKEIICDMERQDGNMPEEKKKCTIS